MCDLEYLYQRFLSLFLKIKANFPELAINRFVYDFMMGLNVDALSNGIDFFVMECMKFQSNFLRVENKELSEENENLRKVNEGIRLEWENINRHENEIVIKKIIQN
ncbi:MAG: hypothetical protein OSJ44_14980, partial [Lachnospiraceae bacterium]|nr:hypothetical protein [Lachnospiraceae bacterium]